MTDLSNLDDYTNLDPAQFAKLVKNTPDPQLAAVLEGEHRKTILDGIFNRMPELFRPQQAGSTNATIHWTIIGGPNGSDTYEVRIANGTCETSAAPTTDAPKLGVTVAPVDFVKLVSGNANPMMLFMGGKLKTKGDVSLAAKIPQLFAIPKA
jgi:SCP-2 sterol transfer family protein